MATFRGSKTLLPTKTDIAFLWAKAFREKTAEHRVYLYKFYKLGQWKKWD